MRRALLGQSGKYRVDGAADIVAQFTGKDENRKRLSIRLTPVAEGLSEPTDIQFVPGKTTPMIVLEKKGRAVWHDLAGKSGTLFEVKVLTASEEGLLGLAFHPDFLHNGKFYTNIVIDVNGQDTSRVSEWIHPHPVDITKGTPRENRVIMEVAQPYQNHNAGQLAFGPDGMLYIGWGDGGWRFDPHGNGQNGMTMLGSMLRIDINKSEGGKPYAVPRDNPFLGKGCCLPETYAIGLRNPWRYSFDPRGRLIVADVGQDLHEEIDIVTAGSNLGWNIREGAHCFQPKTGCRTQGLTEPIYEYGREEGQSITGGYVYTGKSIAALKGKYIFGDFVSGRLWAIDLPEKADGRSGEAITLGKWPLLISTLGRDGAGEIYIANFGTGIIYRLDP